MGGGDDLSQRDEVAARDDVLLLGLDVRQRADEGAEQSGTMVSTPVTSAMDGPCQRASAVKKSRARSGVVPVEDLCHEPPGDLDPLVDRRSV